MVFLGLRGSRLVDGIVCFCALATLGFGNFTHEGNSCGMIRLNLAMKFF